MAIGLLMGLLGIGVRVVGKVGISFNDSKEKIKSQTNGKDTYFDYYGNLRYTNNEHRAIQGEWYKVTDGITIIGDKDTQDGDHVWYDSDTKRIVRNLSKEQREKQKNDIANAQKDRKNKAISEGKTVFPLQKKYWKNDPHGEYIEWEYGKPRCDGKQLKDVKNGNVYVIRELNGIKYYLDVNTRRIARVADEDKDKKAYDINKINSILSKYDDLMYHSHMLEMDDYINSLECKITYFIEREKEDIYTLIDNI